MRTHLHTPVNVVGDHYEIGYQLGEQTSEMLQERYRNLTFGFSPESTWPKPEEYNLENYKLREPERFAKWDKMIKALPKWITEEMHGISDGAKVPYETVLIDKPHFPLIFGVSKKLTEDCNGFIAFKRATFGRRTIVAGNSEDTSVDSRKLNVYSIKNSNGMNMVYAHSKPGCIGLRAGINEKGLAIWGNGVDASEKESGYMGYDLHIIRRTVLETCSNVDEAIDCIKNIPRIGGSRIFLGDRERGVIVEYTSKHLAVLEPSARDYQGGASPTFVNPEMTPYNKVNLNNPEYSFGTLISTLKPSMIDSWSANILDAKRGLFRTQRFHELLEKFYGKLTPEMVPLICGDHGGKGTGLIRNTIDGAIPQGTDSTICRHGHKVGDAYHTIIFGVILVPDEKKMYIAWGSPCQAEYVGFYVPV